MARDTDKRLRGMVMYSIYVRNYSGEGTFKAVQRDLDRIRGLGVDIIWLLPIHPIGQKARKGLLGSPYAIENYRKINPELGTLADFKELVDAIHLRGMKCIIDVVYNHTSPDSWLSRRHPEWFYKKADGSFGNRIGEWSDIIDLDYNQRGLWDYQIGTLKMWAGIVDGFRCDVAPLIPLEFWLRARREVEKIRPGCLWLAESVEPPFILDNRARGMVSLSDSEVFEAFDVCYDYDIFSDFRGFLAGKNTLSQYADKVNMQEYIYPDNYVKLRYLENHDQARAKAILAGERALLNMTAFIYFQKGMTLLYAGQETCNERRPDLFDRDPVSWDTGRGLSGLMARLSALKKDPIFADSRYHVQAVGEELLLASHTHQGRRMAGVFSLKGAEAKVPVDVKDGQYINLIDGSGFRVENAVLPFAGLPLIFEAEGDNRHGSRL